MRIMVQGTSSSCGKSITVAALCRIFNQDGYRVCPFKSQNMSLNSYVDDDGLEMGRAQVLQAQAAGIKPRAFMNPILLKPTTDRKSQVIIMGRPFKNMDAAEYFSYKVSLKDRIKEIYKKIEENFDIVVIEGAGSPAEINLKDNDIVNMGMAEIANSKVILVADIDKGGVFASIYGTYMLLDEDERKRIKGIIINKFRGDKSLLKSGIEKIESLINVPVIGIVPYFNLKLEDEDGAGFRKEKIDGEINIRVINLPRISNFTDFDAFMFDEDVNIRFIEKPNEVEGADMVIIPGSKNTLEDLRWLKVSGFYEKLLNFDGIIFGICGGYQMMGRKVIDEEGWETIKGDEEEGLGFFETITFLLGDKKTRNVTGQAFGKNIKGYEIHMGKTINNKNPFVEICFDKEKYLDGDYKENKYFGTYLHGIFDSGEFRSFILNLLRSKKGLTIKKSFDLEEKRQEELNKLAEIFRQNVDINFIYKLMKEED
ncbi:MAG: cobyric acid synthase [Caloramator sp.]|nr:cobyric acid synthase [Caloramator sp.]